MLRTVLWVSTSFLILSSLVERLFFRRDIFSTKDFSCWIGGLLLTSLFKFQKKNPVFYSRGLIHNSQIWKLLSMLDIDIELRWISVMGAWISLGMIFCDGGIIYRYIIFRVKKPGWCFFNLLVNLWAFSW